MAGWDALCCDHLNLAYNADWTMDPKTGVITRLQCICSARIVFGNYNLCRYTPEDLDRVRLAYSWSLPYVRLLVVVLALLTLLWELMLLATILYFHNMPQKLTGAAFAAIGWFLAYRVWYLPAVTRLTVWTPGLPGRGLIRYQKDSSQ